MSTESHGRKIGDIQAQKGSTDLVSISKNPESHGTEPPIYRAKWGSPDRPLRVGTLEIPCYVLENGTRVLSGRGMQTALALGQRSGNLLKPFLERSHLRPHMSDKLIEDLSNPVRFVRPGRGGKLATGYEATILVDICDAVLAARKADKLSDSEQVIAEQCEILARGFAKVGIIALVDEATGYQADRPRTELHRLLEAYISPEFLPWTKRFDDEFYKQLFRLQGWQYDPLSVKRPKLIGKITANIVYERLPAGVLEKLREKNPEIRPGVRKRRHHQFLTEDIGNPHLEKHLAVVTALMRASPTWIAFRRLLERALPKPKVLDQQEFDLELDDIDEVDL